MPSVKYTFISYTHSKSVVTVDGDDFVNTRPMEALERAAQHWSEMKDDGATVIFYIKELENGYKVFFPVAQSFTEEDVRHIAFEMGVIEDALAR